MKDRRSSSGFVFIFSLILAFCQNAVKGKASKISGGTANNVLVCDQNGNPKDSGHSIDDVITRGNTMLKYKTMLEKKGATVVGGYALGKTKHVRPGTVHSLDDEITSLIMDADW